MADFAITEVDFFAANTLGSPVNAAIQLITKSRNRSVDLSSQFICVAVIVTPGTQYLQGVDAQTQAQHFYDAVDLYITAHATLSLYINVTYDSLTKVTFTANEYGWDLGTTTGGVNPANATLSKIAEIPIVNSITPLSVEVNEEIIFAINGEGLPTGLPSGYEDYGLGFTCDSLSNVIELAGGDFDTRYFQGTFTLKGSKDGEVKANINYQGGIILFNFTVDVIDLVNEIYVSDIKELNKQLYPTGRVWGYVHGSEQVGTEITNFVDSLNNPFVDGFGNAFIQTSGSEASPSKRLVNAFLKSIERYCDDLFSLLNQIIADNDDFDTTDASNWERVYGLVNNSLTLTQRKVNIINRQGYPNGEIERSTAEFIEAELQANGFNVFVQENRFADGAGGWVVQDPDLTATLPEQMGLSEMGTGEMGGDIVGLDPSIIANYIDEAEDETYFDTVFTQNSMGTGEMGVTEMGPFDQLTRDEELRFTFFIGGSVFPSFADVPLARKDEFRQSVLKLKQAHTIVFAYINYI